MTSRAAGPMRALLLGFLALSVLLVPTVIAEERHVPHLRAIGASVYTTWGVAGVQFDDNTAVGVRYWRNATGPETLFLYATVCLGFDADAGSCDHPALHA